MAAAPGGSGHHLSEKIVDDMDLRIALDRLMALAQIGAQLSTDFDDDGKTRALFDSIYHQTADVLERL